VRHVTTIKLLGLLSATILAGCGSSESTNGGDGSDAAPDTSSADQVAPPDDTSADAVVVDSDAADVDAAGCRWSAYHDGLTGGLISTVAIAPKDGSAYAVAGPNVYRASGSVATWEKIGEAPGGVRELAFSPTVAGDVFAASGNGVLSSKDGGKSWTAAGLTGVALYSMHVHPAEAVRLFAGTSGSGIFRSIDGGTSWSGTSVPTVQMEVTSFSGPAANRDEVLASYIELNDAGGWSINGGLLRSTNGGASWSRVLNGGRGHRVVHCASVGGLVWAATGGGLAKSTDSGVTWSTVRTDKYFQDVALAGTGCSTVYATVNPSGVIRSDDGGVTWTAPLDSGFVLAADNRAPVRIAVGPGTPDQVIAATFGGLYYTINKGTSWSGAPGIRNLLIWSLASDAKQAYAAAYGSGLWQRAIAGGAWTRNTAIPDDYMRYIFPSPDGSTVFAAARPLFRSADGGNTFTSVLTDVVMELAFHPTEATTMYVATQTAGVKKSVDGGVTWTAINDGLSPWVTGAGTFIDVRGIVINPTTTTNMIIATHGRGFYRTTDGTKWTAVASAFSMATVTTLARSAKTGELFAKIKGSGIARSGDFGETWTYVNDGLPSLDANIAIDPATGDVYATSGKGIHALRSGGASWVAVDDNCAPNKSYGFGTVITRGADRDLLVAAGGGVIRLSL
jgi:hypothetical protein